MYKCMFCEKHSIKGLYRCEITGQVFKEECEGNTEAQLKYYDNLKNKCPNFTARLSDRLFAWIDLH